VTRSLIFVFLDITFNNGIYLDIPKKKYVPAKEGTSNLIFRKMECAIICPCTAIIFRYLITGHEGPRKRILVTPEILIKLWIEFDYLYIYRAVKGAQINVK
jgi:hypothetical protein